MSGLGDIREIGSGNIGATNVLRTGKKGIAAATLSADIIKGVFAALIGTQFGPDIAVVAALGAFLGHLFPIWLKFQGGKGVATAIGIIFALSWQTGLVAIGTWLLAAALFRYSSLCHCRAHCRLVVGDTAASRVLRRCRHPDLDTASRKYQTIAKGRRNENRFKV